MKTINPVDLTAKQVRFVDEYLIDLNATQAAIRAGYSARTARQTGVENLSKPVIREEIQARIKARSERTQIDADRVLMEISRVAFFDIRKLYSRETGAPIPVHLLDDDTAAALISMDIDEIFEGAGENRRLVGYAKRYRAAPKIEALALAMRHLGLLNDKLKVDARVGLADRLTEARRRRTAKQSERNYEEADGSLGA